MICPRCGCDRCFRSHRRHVEYAISVLGVKPWRCSKCQLRFLARRIPLRYLFRARCPRCANLELERAGRGWLRHNALARVSTLLGALAVRCDPCRHDFVTWRRPWRPREEEEPTDVEGQAWRCQG